jgi:hypothetical protein
MKDSSQQSPTTPAEQDLIFDLNRLNEADLSDVFGNQHQSQASYHPMLFYSLEDLITKLIDNWNTLNQTPIEQLRQVEFYIGQNNILQQQLPSLIDPNPSSYIRSQHNIFINNCYRYEASLRQEQQRYEQKLDHIKTKNNEIWDKFVEDNKQKISFLSPQELEIFQRFLTLIKHYDDIWQDLLVTNHQKSKKFLAENKRMWGLILTYHTYYVRGLPSIQDLIDQYKDAHKVEFEYLKKYNDYLWRKLKDYNQRAFPITNQVSEPIKSIMDTIQTIYNSRQHQLQDFYDAEMSQWQELIQHNELQWQQLQNIDIMGQKPWDIFLTSDPHNTLEYSEKLCQLYRIFKTNDNSANQTLIHRTFAAERYKNNQSEVTGFLINPLVVVGVISRPQQQNTPASTSQAASTGNIGGNWRDRNQAPAHAAGFLINPSVAVGVIPRPLHQTATTRIPTYAETLSANRVQNQNNPSR